MAQDITLRTRFQALSQEKSPNIILQIDGFSEIFGSSAIQGTPRFDDEGLFFDLEGLVFDGLIDIDESRDIISLRSSSTTISQQLEQDRGSVTSVTNLKIGLIDTSADITQLFTQLRGRVLSKEAKVFYMYEGGSFPDDAIVLLDGVITDLTFKAGIVEVRVSHPFQFLRTTLFREFESELTDETASDATSITVDRQVMFLSTADSNFKTYIKINDEIIRYTQVTNFSTTTIFEGLTRGDLNTIAAAHEEGDTVEPFYELRGNCIDMALKLLLSGQRTASPSIELTDVDNVRTTTIPNTLFFAGRNVKTLVGVVPGDTLTISARPGTDNFPFVDQAIAVSVGVNDFGSFIVTQGFTIVGEPEDYDVLIRSQFDVWPIGLGLKPTQVDVGQFVRIRDLFAADFPFMSPYIKGEINVLNFIGEELMFPNGLYLIPRQGRISVGRTTPPLAEFETQLLNKDSVVNPSAIQINQSLNKNYYNTVVYRYDEDSLEDELLEGVGVLSQESLNEINYPTKQLSITAPGFRRGEAGTVGLIERQINAFLDRYKFAAEEVSNVFVKVGTGFNIDVGDTVIFGDPELNIADTQNGDRFFTPRVMEVTNKSWPLTGGPIKLRLLDTQFSALGRFATIAPSSFVQGFSDGLLQLNLSFGQDAFIGEAEKWISFVNQPVRLRRPDFTSTATAIILEVPDNATNNIILTNVDGTIEQGMILELDNYDEVPRIGKQVHAFWNPQVFITSVPSLTVIETGEPELFYEGGVIVVHNEDYSNQSQEVRIDSIDGNQLTLTQELSYTPAIGDEIDLIGFAEDESFPYRIL